MKQLRVALLVAIASLSSEAATDALVVQRAQEERTLDKAVRDALGLMRSAEWRDRRSGFNLLVVLAGPQAAAGQMGGTSVISGLFRKAPDLEELLRQSLIDLLARENSSAMTAPVGTLGEDYMDYWGDLIGAVAGLSDSRAVKTLAQVLTTGGGAIVGLVRIGRPALDTLLESAGARDPSTRVAATSALAQMLDQGPADVRDPRSVARIKAVLVRKAADDYYLVRIAAVRGLATLPGDDVKKLLESIAKNDPFSRLGAGDQGPAYPVRQAAVAALAQSGGHL